MSIFIVGKPGSENFNSRGKAMLDNYVIGEMDKLSHVSSQDSFVYCYTPPKVIDDVFVKVLDSESWLLLVGAPVLDARSDAERQDFAKEFFRNPKNILQNRVDGHYAVLAYDSESKIYFAASDWNSLIPVYYALTKDGPLFSNSELILAKLLQSAPDEFGFAQAIHYGTIWGDRTRFAGVRKLETCELVKVNDDNCLSREKYWEPRMEELWGGSFDAISSRWLEVMRDAIHIFADSRNSGDLSADLTGGEDSRLVVALLLDRGEPFKVRVAGEYNDVDVKVAMKAAEAVGLELSIENNLPATAEELSIYTGEIITNSDGYGSFFTNAVSFTHELHYPPLESKNIHLCGLPGGGQYRGANYLRAKLLFPSSYKYIDYRAYARRKFLLDHAFNLLKIPDDEYFERTYGVMKEAVDEVEGFPAGIQVDHLMRVRYGCLLSANMKRPFYYAFASRDMARSTYNVPPHMKQGGRLYKAIIEQLSPNLAWVKSQSGAPTVKKTLLRQPLFIPEYYSLVKKIVKGVARQKFRKATAFRSKGSVNASHHILEIHQNTIDWLFNTAPYSSWFKSAETMVSGSQYKPLMLNELLLKAQQPDFDQVQLLGRIVSQEMAFRRVYGLMDI